ncbi:MAG: DNA polymerase [Patescibacteria group bacterium]|nr:DNA polymerase [Patescibacteria group bacterium]
MRLWLDTETRSTVPIKYGHMAYSQAVEVIMIQWAIDNGPVIVEDLFAQGFQPSLEFEEAFYSADEVWAHEAAFDRRMLKAAIGLEIPLQRWRCTAALARMHGLPGGLDKLCTIFKVAADKAKDERGKDLIKVFCVPRLKDGLYNTPETHPREWQEFLAYGGQDIVAMREVHRLCPKWNATERMWAGWRVTERENERGIAVDLALAEGAVKATQKAKRELADQTVEITDGDVERTTQRDRLLAYMRDYGVSLPDLKANTVERRLEDESLPEHIKELLRIRQQASKASTAKYQHVLSHQVRGRLYDLIVFCGAQRTGRKAGRVYQPQNLPRPKHEREEIEAAIEAFRGGYIDLVTESDVFGLASSSLRGTLIAPEGKKLVGADLANIEGRFMAWIAGEKWKIKAFEDYDAKRGPDLYKVSYARPFNIDPNTIADEGDQRRQIGKVMELALQYYGGVGAFCSMAETYGLDLNELAHTAWPILPAWAKGDARQALERNKRGTYGLDEKVWLTCEALVLMWRKNHPAIVQFWYDLEKVVVSAIHHPGRQFLVASSRIAIDRRGNWLRVRLPSGRYLSYPAPRWSEETGASFVGVDPYTRQWKRLATYSGKLAENIVQGGAADILIDGQIAAEEAGWNLVLDIHDEDLYECDDTSEYTKERLCELMTTSSPWAVGLPLAAKGSEVYRYRK